MFPHLGRLEALYGKTGVGTRYTCQPREWYYAPHDWVDRTEVFQRHALDLLEEVTLKAAQAAGVQLSELGGLLVNTVTGLAIPSLDAKLMNRVDLPNSMERLPMLGLGCAGGVAGIARSARYAQASRASLSCSSPSICAVFACAPMTRAMPCWCRPRCSATARPA